MYENAPHACNACGDHKRASNPLDLELQVVVPLHVGAGPSLQHPDPPSSYILLFNSVTSVRCLSAQQSFVVYNVGEAALVKHISYFQNFFILTGDINSALQKKL